jgi:uncharacterized OB-fold protein
MSSRLMAKDIYRVRGGSVALLGSKDGSTGNVVFPALAGVQSGEEGFVEISGVGRLWTYTVQRFKPKSPFDDGQPDIEFVPYVVGYVSFEESGVIVEGRIVNAEPDELEIGQEMSICSAVIAKSQGDNVELYAFAPLESLG